MPAPTCHLAGLNRKSAPDVRDKGATMLIVGSGQHGCVHLSDEAAEYFQQDDVDVQLLPTPKAIAAWNHAPQKTIGLFHVTC